MTNQALLTTADLRQILGVSREGIRILRETQGLPHITLGDRTIRYDRDAVQTWLESRTTGAQAAPGKDICHATDH